MAIRRSFSQATTRDCLGCREGWAPEANERLREVTFKAERLGIFGAPSFVTEDGELFWGDDRLEAALEHTERN